MKKTASLVFGMLFLCGGVSAADAGDVKLFGSMSHMFMTDHSFMTEKFQPLTFGSAVQMGFQYIASENLSATVILEAGGGDQHTYFSEWGSGPKMLSGESFKIKHAYLDWIVPSTKIAVRMGLMSWATPHWANGPMAHPPIPEVAGVTVNIPVNQMFTINAGWFRGNNNQGLPELFGTANGTAYYGYNGRDYFYLGATAAGRGFVVQPWFLYDRMASHNYGLDSDAHLAPNWMPVNKAYDPRPGAHTWNIGIGGQISAFDPFVIEFNAAYGKQHNPGKIWWTNVNSNAYPQGGLPNRSGKGFGLKANVGYKTKYGTPTFDAWYYSGDKRNEEVRTGHMPHNGGSNNIAIMRTNRSMFVGDGVGNPRVTGTWGAALSWKNFSFLPGLAHTAIVSFWKGTNNVRYGNLDRGTHDFNYMTTDDRYVEADLITTYQIYPQLTVGLELAYGWADFKKIDIDNGWRITGGIMYKF